MKYVLCNLPNASPHINGVAFQLHPKGMITVNPVEDWLAACFADVPGYVILDVDDDAVATASGEADSSKASDASQNSDTSDDGEQATLAEEEANTTPPTDPASIASIPSKRRKS